MPESTTTDPLFKRKTLAVFICDYCDGDVLANAVRTQSNRA